MAFIPSINRNVVPRKGNGLNYTNIIIVVCRSGQLAQKKEALLFLGIELRKSKS